MFERKHISIKSQLQIIIGLCAVLLSAEILNMLLLRQLNSFGILPRSLDHLTGIIIAPFLHGDFLHFFSNIVPLSIFSFLLLQHGIRRYLAVTVIVIVLGGTAVWLLGRTAIHIGASGVVFGYFGFLLLAGFISGELKLILISLFVGATYGGLIFGVLPIQNGVSWEGHLFGFLAGLLSAYWLARAPKRKRLA